jgi:hypothetical protein
MPCFKDARGHLAHDLGLLLLQHGQLASLVESIIAFREVHYQVHLRLV